MSGCPHQKSIKRVGENQLDEGKFLLLAELPHRVGHQLGQDSLQLPPAQQAKD
jgi:hypothetical protein